MRTTLISMFTAGPQSLLPPRGRGLPLAIALARASRSNSSPAFGVSHGRIPSHVPMDLSYDQCCGTDQGAAQGEGDDHHATVSVLSLGLSFVFAVGRLCHVQRHLGGKSLGLKGNQMWEKLLGTLDVGAFDYYSHRSMVGMQAPKEKKSGSPPMDSATGWPNTFLIPCPLLSVQRCERPKNGVLGPENAGDRWRGVVRWSR